jgi:hypothetical protein
MVGVFNSVISNSQNYKSEQMQSEQDGAGKEELQLEEKLLKKKIEELVTSCESPFPNIG